MDLFCRPSMRHYVVVPSADLKMFSESCSRANRIFLCQEDVVPSYWYPFLASFRSLSRHRGWLIQQIVKIASPAYASEENLVFLDSDVIFIREIHDEIFFQDGLLRFFKDGAAQQSKWIDASCRILKLANTEDKPLNYINQLLTWRRSNVVKLQNYIEKVHGNPWPKVFKQEKIFSEYNTYGVFYDRVLKDGSQTEVHGNLTYNVWNQEDYAALSRDIGRIKDEYVGLLLQSHIDTETESDLHEKYVRPLLSK